MNILQRKNRPTEYFNPADSGSRLRLGRRIEAGLRDEFCSGGDTVVLCIGTDRATGDALGPIVGSMLSERSTSFKVYGTLRQPVHALNLKEYIHKIYSTHVSPVVIAIDASLGNHPDVGLVTLSHSPLYPGIGVNKKLPAIGDMSITGIVNISGKPGLSMLQSTRLYTVMNMSEYIAGALLYADGR